MTLTVDRLAVRRGRTAVLHDISLTVGSGEFVCLLGSNGAGKTTLLDCVAGLVRPRSGTLDWNGTDLATLPTHRLVAAGISYAMAGRRLFTGLSVADNVLIGARDTPRRALAARLDAAWTLFPALYERRTARAGGLSGGQQQMLVIAQALACRPKLLLLDEPSAGLAPLLAQEVFAALRTLRELDELSLLVVEQNTEGALGLCDRAYVIDAGTVALRGTCAEVAADDAVSRIYLGGMADVRRRRA